MTDYTEALSHLSPVYTRYTEIIPEHAEGCYVYDLDGNAYLDFTCGIGVTNTGHCHPRVVEAIRNQAGLLLHGQVNILVHKPLLELISELRTIVPPAIDGFFFTNSGAEAVEGAVKLARVATRPAERDRLPGQLPWAHGRHHVADHIQDHLPRRLPAAHAGRVRGALSLTPSVTDGSRNRPAAGAWTSWSCCCPARPHPRKPRRC